MKLLILSPFPFGPNASHGGAVAAYAEFSALKQQHEIAVCAFEPPGTGPLATKYLREQAREYVGVALPLGFMRRRLARLKSVLTMRPVDACLYRVPAMTKALRELIQRFKPEAVLIQFPQMAQYVTHLSEIPAFMDVQDAYSVSAFRVANSHHGWKRWERLHNWLAWVAYERQYYPLFHHVLTLTEQDLIGLRVFSPELAGSSIGIPLEIPAKVDREINPFSIRFVGAFGHLPNVAGMEWFLREVWPSIQVQEPRAHVEIAGKNPPPQLLALADDKVKFIGFVDDLYQFLGTAHVVIVPLRSGGGIKIKTLEAMAAGAAVVTTSIGAEGIGGVHGVHYLVQDKARDFYFCLLSVFADDSVRMRLSSAGQSLITSRYAPSAWVEMFLRAVHEVVVKNNLERC